MSGGPCIVKDCDEVSVGTATIHIPPDIDQEVEFCAEHLRQISVDVVTGVSIAEPPRRVDRSFDPASYGEPPWLE